MKPYYSVGQLRPGMRIAGLPHGDKIIGLDVGRGPDWNAEATFTRNADGTVTITEIQRWRGTIDPEGNPA